MYQFNKLNKYIFGFIYITTGTIYFTGGAHMLNNIYKLRQYNVLYINHQHFYYKITIPMFITMVYGIENILNGAQLIYKSIHDY